MTAGLAAYHVPHALEGTVLGSIGGALGVAAHLGGAAGALLGHVARSAFISVMDLGLRTGAAAELAGCVLALVALPARPPTDRDPVTPATEDPTAPGTPESDDPAAPAPRPAGT